MLDELLIKLAKDQSKTLTDRDEIPYSPELRLTKIAFDFYKIDNDPYEHLWRMESRGDKSVLVRASDPQYDVKAQDDWAAISDYDRANITLSYKNIPIQRFSSDEYGFEADDVFAFKGALLERVKTDQDFVKDMLNSQPKLMREAILGTFPELKKFQG